MLKRIPVKDLRLGMHLEAFCGSWMDHPFWRTKFVLSDPDDIKRVRESGIQEVMIDISKGLDVVLDIAEAIAPQIIVEAPREEVPPEPQPEAAAATARVDLQAEAQRAAKITRKAKSAVVSMFQEVRMGKAIDAEQALPLVEEISESVNRNPSAMVSLARLKTADEYTFMHSVAVCALMIALARQLNLNEELTRQAGLAGLLHDMGKAFVPAEVLNKPGKLTDQEFNIIKKHPELGHRALLEARGAGEIALDVCLHHHERVDGRGYPHGLERAHISLFAKMGAVCDVYDAITSNRPYKSGWDPAESIRKMAEWVNGHFEEDIFKAFVRALGIYPVGSLVRMESQRLALVIDQNQQLTLPVVKVFFSIKSQTHLKPEVLDLSRPGMRDRIVGREDPAAWGFKKLDQLWAGEISPR